MAVEKLASILGAIIVLAGVTVVVSHPTSVSAINALGGAFSGSVKTAMGR